MSDIDRSPRLAPGFELPPPPPPDDTPTLFRKTEKKWAKQIVRMQALTSVERCLNLHSFVCLHSLEFTAGGACV